MGLPGRHVDRPRGGRSNERGSRSPDACARWTIARERAGAIRPSGGGDSGSIGPQPGRRNLEVTEVLRNPEAAIFRGRKSLRIKVITTARPLATGHPCNRAAREHDAPRIGALTGRPFIEANGSDCVSFVRARSAMTMRTTTIIARVFNAVVWTLF